MKDEVFHFCFSEVPPTLAEGNGSAKFVKVEYNSKNLLLLLRRIQDYPKWLDFAHRFTQIYTDFFGLEDNMNNTDNLLM